MDNNFEICLTSPNDQNIISLIEDLSQNLEKRFGSSGKNSFQDWKDNDSKYIFLSIVEHNEFIGCGGIRPLGNSIGEIKRMFAKYKSRGIGSVILDNLEKEAKISLKVKQNINYIYHSLFTISFKKILKKLVNGIVYPVG